MQRANNDWFIIKINNYPINIGERLVRPSLKDFTFNPHTGAFEVPNTSIYLDEEDYLYSLETYDSIISVEGFCVGTKLPDNYQEIIQTAYDTGYELTYELDDYNGIVTGISLVQERRFIGDADIPEFL